MDFRTRVLIDESDIRISHKTKMMLFGSCFSENIGTKLKYNKFDVDVNPFGILYNPMSISKCIRRLIDKREFTEADLVQENEIYHSFMHHGIFSYPDKEKCLDNINFRFNKAKHFIDKSDVILITFGTAYVFCLHSNNEIVSNCHKFPASKFNRYRLTIDEIVEEWYNLIDLLRDLNPKVRIVFTVSPIRHFKDGAHDNQISKSILHLAVESLQQKFKDLIDYFPAYEIMMDELRDYRFYNEDMTHPSPMAQEYIWQRFADRYFTDSVKNINKEWTQISKSINHRPLRTDTQSYYKFISKTIESLQLFSKKYPHISCEEEINHFSKLVNANNI